MLYFNDLNSEFVIKLNNLSEDFLVSLDVQIRDGETELTLEGDLDRCDNFLREAKSLARQFEVDLKEIGVHKL